jgi:hypothetical protein
MRSGRVDGGVARLIPGIARLISGVARLNPSLASLRFGVARPKFGVAGPRAGLATLRGGLATPEFDHERPPVSLVMLDFGPTRQKLGLAILSRSLARRVRTRATPAFGRAWPKRRPAPPRLGATRRDGDLARPIFRARVRIVPITVPRSSSAAPISGRSLGRSDRRIRGSLRDVEARRRASRRSRGWSSRAPEAPRGDGTRQS